MNRIQRSGLAVAFVSIMGLSALSSGAFAQANCDIYAKRALKQAREYAQKKCGPVDARWGTNLNDHRTWCLSVGPAQWRGELKKSRRRIIDD